MDEFGLFAVKSKKANKTNPSIPFLGESMACQSAFEINWPLAMKLNMQVEEIINFEIFEEVFHNFVKSDGDII